MHLDFLRTIQDDLCPNEIIIVSFKSQKVLFEQETLWSLYPRKKSKKDALRHYIGARKKGAEYNDVLNGLYAYFQADRVHQQCLLTTYSYRTSK